MRGRSGELCIILVTLLLLFSGAAGAVELKTNRSKALVPLDEIVPGGPPPDGIPAIDRPKFGKPFLRLLVKFQVLDTKRFCPTFFFFDHFILL